MASRSTSRGALTSVGNIDTRRSKQHKKPDVSSHVHYPWHSAGVVESLSERKKRTEERREELLVLLYQENLTTSQVEELVHEWVSLVAERDKLLHEEINKENYTERTRYVQELRRILRDRSLLGEGNEEMDIRMALLELDRQVSQYCKSHHITSPPHARGGPQVQIKVGGVPVPMREPQRPPPPPPLQIKPTPSRKTDMLDHETGQSGVLCLNHSSFESSTPKQNSINEEVDGGSCNQIDSNMNTPVLLTPTMQIPDVMVTEPPCTPPIPQPPTPPPLPINWLLGGRGGGTAGTVQFPGSSRLTEIASTSANHDAPYNNDVPDPSFIDTPSERERKSLMDEISSVGQSVLRRTTRARSPGGTPIKYSKHRLTLTGNTDMLQRALISKFRSLHSTPIHNGIGDHDRGKEESFDFSNTWSDINNSVAYDDPDLSVTSNSGLSSNHSQTGSQGSVSSYSQPGGKRRHGVHVATSHNTSTAV